MPQWPVPAENAILVSGLPLFFEYEAYDTIYPGYAVSLDAAMEAHIVRRCTAEGVNIIGIADLAMSSQTGRGSWRKYDCNDESEDSDRDLPYLIGDQVKVISGPITVMLVLCASQDIQPGTKLQCCDGSPGMVQEYLCATASPCGLIAEAMEEVTTGEGECAYIHAKLLV